VVLQEEVTFRQESVLVPPEGGQILGLGFLAKRGEGIVLVTNGAHELYGGVVAHADSIVIG